MAQKKSYSRYFIILQEDEPGYSLASDKLPSGYTKLETKNDKCKISYYVQNLKKDKEPYYMVLICNKKDTKKLIKLGMLNIDDYGRAEITYEFPADDVAESKIAVDVVGGAAIVRMENSNIIPVMSGFTLSEPPKDWRSYSVFEESIEELKNEIQEDKERESKNLQQVETKMVEIPDKPKEEKNIFDEYEQKIEEIKLTDEDRSEKEIKVTSMDEVQDNVVNGLKEEEAEVKEVEYIEQIENYVEDIRHEDEEDEENEENEDRDIDKENENIVKQNENIDKENENIDKENENIDKQNENINKHREDEKCECDNKNYPTGTVGEFFRLLADDFIEMEDICTEIKKCRWYRIPAENLEGMCNYSNYNKYTIVYYPMMSYYPYVKKHGHYIMGYKYDSKGKMKYLVYGVPGTKKRNDQPYGGKSGFVTWVPVKEGDETEESFGYWLMFYDFRTSTIVIPVK